MRLAIDISPLINPASGIGRSVSGLMWELPDLANDAGITLVPYFRKALGMHNPTLQQGLRYTRIRVPQFLERWISSLGLIEASTQAAIFHATDFYSPVKPKSPLISTVHDVIYALSPENELDHLRIRNAMPRYLPQCVRVITCSHNSAYDFCNLYGYPMENVSVIHWGVDTNFFRPLANCPTEPRHDAPYFLSVSCNSQRKNTPRLVEAFINYALAGGTYNLKLTWTLPDYIIRKVSECGMSGRVIGLGKVSDLELRDLYQHTSCLMFPSLYEGFGFPVLEALACGVPVLTTRRSSLEEVGGELALYVDGTDAREITNAMFALQKGDLKSFAENVRTSGPSWASKFSWRTCAENTIQAYLLAFRTLENNHRNSR